MSETNPTPRLLFLAYAFPPSRAIGGVRCWNIAKHLTRRGWRVDVVTIDPQQISNPEPNVNLVENCKQAGISLRPTPAAGRLLMGGWFKLPWWQPQPLASLTRRIAHKCGIDPAQPWAAAAIRACNELRPGDIDVVLASGPPYPVFQAAVTLGRRLGARVVLDYRDLWTGNPHYTGYAREKNRQLEASLLNSASGITVISPAMAESIRTAFRPSAPIQVISNGYDPAEYEAVTPKRFEDFAIVYAGRFYPPHRIVDPLVSAVVAANRRSPAKPIRLHYFGSDETHVKEAANKLGANHHIICHGNRPRQEILAALKGANIGAVITTVHAQATKEEQGIVTGKLFESIGAGAPVLLIAPAQSDAARLVVDNHAGAAFPGTDIPSIANWIFDQANQTNAQPSKPCRPLSWPSISAGLDAFLLSSQVKPLAAP